MPETWELNWLAERAVELAGDKAVGIVRGYGKGSRARGAGLRARLAARNRAVVDIIVPMPGLHSDAAAIHRLGEGLGVLVDVGRRDGVDGMRLAALLGVPLLAAGHRTETGGSAVIGVHTEDLVSDVALRQVRLRPLTGRDDRVALSLDGGASDVVAGAMLTVDLAGGPEPLLHYGVGDRVAAGEGLTLEPVDGVYAVEVDGRPVADLTDPIGLRVLADRLTVLAPAEHELPAAREVSALL